MYHRFISFVGSHWAEISVVTAAVTLCVIIAYWTYKHRSVCAVQVPACYWNHLYGDCTGGGSLPIPVRCGDQLRVVYRIPGCASMYDDLLHCSSTWNSDYVLDRCNPNESIKLGDILLNEKAWMTWGPYPTIWKNQFDPGKFGRNILGITPDQAYVEVNRRMGDITEGIWFTISPGSGMFFRLPSHSKILVTRNKLSALFALLGDDPAAKIAEKYPNFQWNGWGNTGTDYDHEKDYIRETFGVDTLTEVIEIAADNQDQRKMGLEWVANCPVVDNWVKELAAAQGYELVQYYNAAYNGFWSNEFNWIGQPQSVSDVITQRIVTTHSPCEDLSPDSVLSCQFCGGAPPSR